MEDVNEVNNGKKRVRRDSEVGSPEMRRVDSEESDLSSRDAKRIRKDSDLNSSDLNTVDSAESVFDSAESVLNSTEANRIPNDILGILEDPDTVTETDPEIQDLDSVIRSFEEEILHPSLPAPQQHPEVRIVSSDPCESQPDLGYLLEASDDELGLPPTVSPPYEEETKTNIDPSDLATISPEAVGLSASFLFEDEFPGYDSFGFGIGEETPYNDNDFVTVGGLFDYDPADFSESAYRPESLPAL